MSSDERSEANSWLETDYWSLERQLIGDILNEASLDRSYRQHLICLLDRWARPEASHVSLETLPILVCVACGGNPHQVVPVCVAWRLLRLGAKLLDDLEDGEVREGLPEMINSAVGLLFAGQLALSKLGDEGLPPTLIQSLSQELCRAGLAACGGQHVDLTVTSPDPDRWLEIAAAKSGVPIGWAVWASALVAGAQESVLASYREYATSLGVLLQIADDYNGVWYPDHVGDLMTKRPTLPVVYALSVATTSEQKSQLQALLDDARQGDIEADRRARKLLIDMGAQAFMLVLGQMWYNRAAQSLKQAGGDHPAKHRLLLALQQVFPALQDHAKD